MSLPSFLAIRFCMLMTKNLFVFSEKISGKSASTSHTSKPCDGEQSKWVRCQEGLQLILFMLFDLFNQ